MTTFVAEVAVDSSVAVALSLPRHPHHRPARDATGDRRPVLVGHARLETYSVLTRIPPPFRMPPSMARRVLHHDFPDLRWLSADEHSTLWDAVLDAGVGGGAVYDALVGLSASLHGLELLTADQRARRTYQAVGVETSLVA